MKAFELTRAAKRDLRNIATFTEKRWSRNQRYLYMKQFNDVFDFLAEHPFTGKKCDSIKPGFIPVTNRFSAAMHVARARRQRCASSP